jgi:serine/threonine-protein kinase RsbW
VATVTVSFTPLPPHVHTARFIATSVARRAGVAEAVLDEIRLAVSEACSVAVRFHLSHAPTSPVELRMSDSDQVFSVQVADSVSRPAPDGGGGIVHDLADDDLGLAIAVAGNAAAGSILGSATAVVEAEPAASGDLRVHERIGLAVISGLVDDVTVEYLDTGSVVTMSCPIAPEPAADAG